jgi:GalNAc5-diNAcBac-PP-undecaprenol beta-1,3-glucosyltransferase
MNPLVTIIMATYNREHLIEETLSSIQNQSYKNWECLIIDDWATDNTKEVLERLLKFDTRFQYHRRPKKYKKGLPGCRNYGLDLAKGDLVIFFDDDDIVHPQNLELCASVLKSNSYEFCVYNKQSFTGSFIGTLWLNIQIMTRGI